MKHLLWILLVSFFSLACTQEDLTGKICPVEGVNGDPNSIIGKWWLITERQPYVSFEEINYSCHQILFEFREEGVVRISSKGKTPLPSGDYPYEITEKSIPGLPDTVMNFNSNIMAFTVSAKELTLDGSHVDGPIWKLIRISPS